MAPKLTQKSLKRYLVKSLLKICIDNVTVIYMFVHFLEEFQKDDEA